MDKRLYRDYFNIDPKYYAAVTEDLIKSGKVKWDAFYPHETFVKLLEKTHVMLSGKDSRSLWVEGAYGTGKSHAALTVKSLLEASDEEIRAYFQDYGLKNDLCEQLIADKNGGKLITIHRIGSSSIRSDNDLILAIQDSITEALRKHGIENKGEASLKEAALKWFDAREANRQYFDSLIQEDKYAWDFGGMHVDEVIQTLQNSDDPKTVSDLMRNILKVAEDNGITALRLDIPTMCTWIKSILEQNDISAILFVWDEFTEYFINNQNSLSGFQTLIEISESHPFYFLIVTHESSSIIKDKDMRKKILNRFVGDVTIRIEMPENMAFRLMAQAMKETDDPQLRAEWEECKSELNGELTGVRNTITDSAKKHATMGSKTVISDKELQEIVPIHPYAALLLKHMSVAFNSNARSMFDFIISNDMTDAKGFKWFINEHGAMDDTNLLTIDMLWDFFTGKNQDGLNDDVRVILDSYNLLKKGSLTPDEDRVLKTILLLEAISIRVGDVELLRPNAQNIDLAFNGTDWSKGKAMNIAAGLCAKGILFEKPVGNNVREYTIANNGSDKAKLDALKEEIRKSTRTQDLIDLGDLLGGVVLPESIRGRFVMTSTATSSYTLDINKANNSIRSNRFQTVVTFALNDSEATSLDGQITKTVVAPNNQLYIIQSLVPMGDDAFKLYVESMAFSKNYSQNDRQRALGYENQAKKCLNEWRQRIANGAFMLYTPDNKSGIRAANLPALQEELLKINRMAYPCGLEQYSLIGNMFSKGPTAQGAECGITQELKGTFKSSNAKTSFATALEGAWKVEKYWEDPTKKSLPIVRIKQRVDSVIQDGFDHSSGRISILSIFESLEDEPFGFLPNNASALVLGFVLKEYVSPEYFWSNGSTSTAMTADKMKSMIAGAINQKFAPNAKYREEYIVAMSLGQRYFLQCTQKAFHISPELCDSVEHARDQIRIKMKKLTFPIWCIKYLLDTEELESPKEEIEQVINAYCGIANTANSTMGSESDLAERIGNLVKENPLISEDLVKLFTNDNCRKGMLCYIGQYQDGILPKLAAEIGDNGGYIDQVKQKFNADAANWVWNSETADDVISKVILEYKIIAESNKSLPHSISLKDTVVRWSQCAFNIHISYEVLKHYTGDLTPFLEQLKIIQTGGQLLENNEETFYELLLSQRENFIQFYNDQFAVFKEAAKNYLVGLDDEAAAEYFNKIPSGQFLKSDTEYYQYIKKGIEEYRKGQKKNVLKDLWREKTGTKDPEDWSDYFSTPILCMFDDKERGEAKEMLDMLLSKSNPKDSDIEKAIEYLEHGTFYERLKDSAERDRCFMENIVGEYQVFLNDPDEIRDNLKEAKLDKVYNWMDNSAVRNNLKILAEVASQTEGKSQARKVIDGKSDAELRQYINQLLDDNLDVVMAILKNK